jgi:hypothetical protein
MGFSSLADFQPGLNLRSRGLSWFGHHKVKIYARKRQSGSSL